MRQVLVLLGAQVIKIFIDHRDVFQVTVNLVRIYKVNVYLRKIGQHNLGQGKKLIARNGFHPLFLKQLVVNFMQRKKLYVKISDAVIGRLCKKLLYSIKRRAEKRLSDQVSKVFLQISCRPFVVKNDGTVLQVIAKFRDQVFCYFL
ncbi:hypothetical protein D3C86_1414960 [compost metagenome]